MDNKNRYLTEIISEVDRLPCSHPASVNIDVANFYYSLTKMIRPILVLEIGCFIGLSTLHFAQALREQGFGNIISIDTFDWDVDAGRGLENREIVARRYLDKAQLGEIVTIVKGNSVDVYNDIENKIKNKIDLLYIDGDHSINGVFEDFNKYYNEVREGGIVILHDIYPEMCGEYGPRVLIDSLKNKGFIPRCIDLIELPTKDGFGVSILRKKSSKHIHVNVPVYAAPKTLVSRCVRRIRSKYPNFFKKNYSNSCSGLELIILDEEDNSPVEGALVVCPQRWDEMRRSDASGKVYFEHYMPNRYLFDITVAGFCEIKDYLIDVEKSDTLLSFNIYLKKEPS